tara:strand:- start:472 stop:1611 length:1140 start_codon:yes stop_codon:yes gene_type:complete
MISKDKKIFIVANCTWYLYNFRSDLLKRLFINGYKIIVISTKDNYYKNISKYLFKFEKLHLIRGSENPILEIITLLNILFLYLKYKPAFVHHFTIKPCLYGSIIARLVGSKKIINHITGLGPSLYSYRIKLQLLNLFLFPFYRYAFNNKNALNIFHNISDMNSFIERKFTSARQCIIISGSGVDVNYFKRKEVKNNFNKDIQILFPARIIEEKGILELIDACEELWIESYKFTLNIAGEIDKQNKTFLKGKNLKRLFNKNINFLGKSNNIFSIYKTIDIVVLPSWREGLSKSLLEAASMSLPIITTDVPGCREVIKDKYSGLLVPRKNKYKLKLAIKTYLENPDLAIKYGTRARESIHINFSLEKINNKIISIYENYFD